MNGCVGVKLEVDGMNEARIERIRDSVCREWEFEKDGISFYRRPGGIACMIAISAGCPCGNERGLEFAERLAEAVWESNGSYCRVQVSIEDSANVCAFDEQGFKRIMKAGQ